MKQKEDEILVEEEILEINAATSGRAPIQLPGKIASIFPALLHRDFQLYFSGQLPSLMGFWLQLVGLQYLVFQLTHSEFFLGLVTAAGGLPTTFITAIAGVIIDRVDKRKLLIGIQIVQGALALILGFAVLFGLESIPMILFLTLLTGFGAAFDLPARQSFIVDLVGKKDLPSAISVNMATFNSARFIGPAIAAVLIATVGVGWAFIANGLSFLPIIYMLTKIHPMKTENNEVHDHPLDSLKEGVKFVFTHEKLLYLILLAAATALFIWPYQGLMAAISEKIFQAGALGIGSLLTAAGLGSLAGVFYIATQNRREERGILVFLGAALSAIGLIIFSFNRNFVFAHLLLLISSFGLIVQVANVNTTVQLLAPDNMRGRVLGVYLTMFVGMMPFGSLLMGTLAQQTSSMFAVGFGGFVLLVFASFLYFKGYLK